MTLKNLSRKRSQSAGPGSRVFDKSMIPGSSSTSNFLMSSSHATDAANANDEGEGGEPQPPPPPRPTACELRVAQYEKPLTKGHRTKKSLNYQAGVTGEKKDAEKLVKKRNEKKQRSAVLKEKVRN